MSELVNLFEPGTIGKMEIRNRIVMPAMGVRATDEDQRVTDRMIDYYSERARGGVGLIIVEHSSVMANACGGKDHLGAHDDSFIPGLRRLAQAVKSHGAKVALQVGHHGHQISHSHRLVGFTPGDQVIVAPSAVPEVRTGVTPKELSRDEIVEVVEAYAEAARRAQEAGFSAVEIHGAHGKLITQFLSPFYNRRRDEYGGDSEKRARFPCDILKRTRQKVGPDFPIILRVNAYDGFPGGATLEDLLVQAPLFVKAGADALHVSSGADEGTHWQHITYLQPPGVLAPFARAVKKVVHVPIITVGKLGNPLEAERVLREGMADFVAMGRAHLADPYLATKAKEERLDDISYCIYCENCRSRPRPGSLACTVNPALLREREFVLRPAPSAKNVVVVGGGLAGMEAARVAAKRGHKVALYERSDKLGGQWNLACLQEHKESFITLTNRLMKGLREAGVTVALNQEVTPALVQEVRPDSVVVATGASPATLDVPGAKRDNVIQAVDVVTGKTETGQEVVVVGGRYLGMEVALALAKQGKKVSLVEQYEIGWGVAHSVKLALIEQLIAIGVYQYPNSPVVQITEQGVSIVRDHTLISLRADTVVLAVGFRAENQLAQELRDLVAEVYEIGDCVEPRNALDAVKEGAEVGRQV